MRHPKNVLLPCFGRTAEALNLCRIGWRWLVWRHFSHKNRTQLPSRLQLQHSKRLMRASGIFDSHHPLHFPPSLANASQCSAQPRAALYIRRRWLALVSRGFTRNLVG
jgi:hypothetical protein